MEPESAQEIHLKIIDLWAERQQKVVDHNDQIAAIDMKSITLHKQLAAELQKQPIFIEQPYEPSDF